jgi:hypothetical protein
VVTLLSLSQSLPTAPNFIANLGIY